MEQWNNWIIGYLVQALLEDTDKYDIGSGDGILFENSLALKGCSRIKFVEVY